MHRVKNTYIHKTYYIHSSTPCQLRMLRSKIKLKISVENLGPYILGFGVGQARVFCCCCFFVFLIEVTWAYNIVSVSCVQHCILNSVYKWGKRVTVPTADKGILSRIFFK